MDIIINNKPVSIEPYERILMDLINGKPAVNESEKELELELEQMKKDGFTPYIPSNL
jgi:hypothetical protein